MGYRGGYLSGLDFAVDMLGFQPVAHKYQRGDNSIIAYNLDFFFRIVEVYFPTGLQLDDQIAPSQMVRTLTEFGGSLVPVARKQASARGDELYATKFLYPIMRYAEGLLSYLEAVNESQPNAVDQNLLDLTINDIRDRVKLVGIKKTDVATQELVREAVRKERRVELAFEGLRSSRYRQKPLLHSIFLLFLQ